MWNSVAYIEDASAGLPMQARVFCNACLTRKEEWLCYELQTTHFRVSKGILCGAQCLSAPVALQAVQQKTHLVPDACQDQVQFSHTACNNTHPGLLFTTVLMKGGFEVLHSATDTWIQITDDESWLASIYHQNNELLSLG